MANSKTESEYAKYAVVDTAPSASGYFTDAINFREQNIDRVSFFIQGTGDIEITLQWRNDRYATEWTDYRSYGDNTRFEINGDSVGEEWRAGVKNASAYISGSKTFGFDW